LPVFKVQILLSVRKQVFVHIFASSSPPQGVYWITSYRYNPDDLPVIKPDQLNPGIDVIPLPYRCRDNGLSTFGYGSLHNLPHNLVFYKIYL
jgi:hypothetical protein